MGSQVEINWDNWQEFIRECPLCSGEVIEQDDSTEDSWVTYLACASCSWELWGLNWGSVEDEKSKWLG
jgi:hypothetical protein